MSEKRLTQEELLEELSRASAGTYGRRKQMHNQLKEIVGWYFDEGIQQIIGDLKKTEDWEIEI